jgi:hypothetical protein
MIGAEKKTPILFCWDWRFFLQKKSLDTLPQLIGPVIDIL